MELSNLLQIREDGVLLFGIVWELFWRVAVGNLCRVTTSFQAKALAALYSLEIAALLGMTRIILETDAIEFMRGLTSEDLDHSVDGVLLKQIRDLIESDFIYCEI